jgi:hypothetical protein
VALAAGGSPPDILAMPDSQLRASGGTGGSFGAAGGHFLPYHVLDFWLNLALCHALLVEDIEGTRVYQVKSSPAPLPHSCMCQRPAPSHNANHVR